MDMIAPNAALRLQIVPGESDQTPITVDGEGDSCLASTRARMSWAPRLKRVFAIDITTCRQCSGPLTLIAVIEESAVIVKILRHVGLPAPPTKSPGPSRRGIHRQQGLGFDPQRVLWYVAGHSKGPIEASLPDLCITWWREGYLSRANRAFIDFLLEQNPI